MGMEYLIDEDEFDNMDKVNISICILYMSYLVNKINIFY